MSVSVFNLISKLFNVPLLNITTSFVAEEQASLDKRDDNFSQLNEGNFLEYLSYCIVLCFGFCMTSFCFICFLNEYFWVFGCMKISKVGVKAKNTFPQCQLH